MSDILEQVRAILRAYPDPDSGQPVEEAGRVVALREEHGVVKFILDFPSKKDADDFEPLRMQAIEQIREIEGVKDVQAAVSAPAVAPAPPNLKPSAAKPAPKPAANPSGIRHI